MLCKLSGIKKIDKNVSRVYFGNEFCDFLIPGKSEINRLFDITNKPGIKVSIVTPYLNERSLRNAEKLLSHINRNFPDTEIIVNDWGVFHLIKNNLPDLEIVMGRLLTRQKRGFFVKSKDSGVELIRKLRLTKADRSYLKCSVLQNSYMMDFISAAGIKRIGLDNTLQGIDISGYRKFNIDLYYPYAYITTSNYCLTPLLEKGGGLRDKIYKCDKICLRSKVRTIQVLGRNIYLAGNTQFYRNELIKVEDNRINRIITCSL